MTWLYEYVSGIASRKTEQVLTWWRHRIVIMTAIAACCLLALIGVVFFAVAGYTALLEAVAPWAAGLIIGAILVALSLIGALTIWLISQRLANERQKEQPTEPEGSSDEVPVEVPIETVTHIGQTIGASLNNYRIRTTDVVIAALVAGTVLGASPALRNRLLQRRKRSATTPRPDREHYSTLR